VSLKIMVVDDKPISMKVIRPLAAPLGHTVLTFDDAHEVGERAQKQRFDVFFLDMSRSDGLELVRRIRDTQPNHEATIVMLGDMDEADGRDGVRKALGEGADFVFTKPVTPTNLRSILAAMDSAGWKGKRHTVRIPLFAEGTWTLDGRKFPFRSTNISESGMLLQTSPDIEINVDEKLSLEFKIAEVHASLSVLARIVRKEGTDRVGVEFIGLSPEDKNAIQLFVMVRMKHLEPERDLSRIGMNRLLVPKE
jgi:CheY-like chemotaxis protein